MSRKKLAIIIALSACVVYVAIRDATRGASISGVTLFAIFPYVIYKLLEKED